MTDRLPKDETTGGYFATEVYTSKAFNSSGVLVAQVGPKYRLGARKVGTVERRRLDGLRRKTVDRSGWRDPTPYYGSYSSRTEYPMSITVIEQGANKYVRTYENCILGSVPALPAALTSPSSLATSMNGAVQTSGLSKFHNAGYEGGIDLSLAFAERKQTVNLLESTARKLVSGAIDLKHGRIRRAFSTWTGIVPDTLKDKNPVSTISAVADRWLEYRYGWVPLVCDVYGAAETLARNDAGSYDRYRVHVKSRRPAENSTVTTASSSVGSAGYYYSCDIRIVIVQQVVNKVSYYADITNVDYVKLSDVGLADPLSTAWELLPYSFIADWFVNVGEYLGAHSALNGYTWRPGTQTVHESRQTNVDIVKMKPGSGYSLLSSNGVGKAVLQSTDECFVRTVQSAPPTPSLVINPDPLTKKRVADAVALVWNFFKK